MRSHNRVLIINLIFFIILFLLSSMTAVQAESNNDNQPLYSIERSQAIIKVDMQNNT